MSVAMLMAIIVAGASLAILSQQVTFTRMVRSQAFLLEDAPTINNLFSRMLGRANDYRVYADVSAAKSGGTSILADGHALLLRFRQPDGSLINAILAAEDAGTGRVRVGFYYTKSNTWKAAPDWVLTSAPTDLTFSIENGVLRALFTGPEGEQITYSGHTQS
jgi:hypothetical protein